VRHAERILKWAGAWWGIRNTVARRGERVAARLVARRGLKVISRNLVINGVEIDLVAYDPVQDAFVLIEVKTTSDGSDGTRRIDRFKRRRYARAARSIAWRVRVRVEAVAIALDGRGTIRRWIR